MRNKFVDIQYLEFPLKKFFNRIQILVGITAIVFLPLLGLAQDNEVLFKSANEQYSKQHYSEAIKGYKSIMNKGFVSAELFFNIGNCYYKTDSIAAAILYYEKAKKLNPADDDILTNLKMANLRTTDKVEVVPELFLNTWYKTLVNRFSDDVWASLSILLVFLAFLLFAFFSVSKVTFRKQSFFFVGLFFFVSAIVTYIFAGEQNSQLSKTSKGVVFASTLAVKSAPIINSTDLFMLHEGTTIKVLEKADGWYRVKLENGNEGWVPSKAVELI